jgi:hypothetical protein
MISIKYQHTGIYITNILKIIVMLPSITIDKNNHKIANVAVAAARQKKTNVQCP